VIEGFTAFLGVTTSIALVRSPGRAASHLRLIHLAPLLSATTHGLPGTLFRIAPPAEGHLHFFIWKWLPSHWNC